MFDNALRALKKLRCKKAEDIVWVNEDGNAVDTVKGSLKELKWRGTLVEYFAENPEQLVPMVDAAYKRLELMEQFDVHELTQFYSGVSPVENHVVGLGTYGWKYDHNVIKQAIVAGIRFIDTAETYGYGRVETALGEALLYPTEPILMATKVSRNHLSYKSVVNAANRSLDKLGLDKLDLYQIHWPNPKFPLAGTIDAMRHLVNSGSIGAVGMCNCSVDQLMVVQRELMPIELAAVQVRYNLMDRGIERALLPYCQSIGLPVIAYSPLGQKFPLMLKSKGGPVLCDVAARYGISPVQVALAWLMTWDKVVPIPRTNNPDHAVEIAESVYVDLELADRELLDDAFPIKE